MVQRGAPTDGGDLGGAGGQPAGVPPVHRQRPRDPPHEVSGEPCERSASVSCCPGHRFLCLLTQLSNAIKNQHS